jgi:hypothetical protein
MALNAQILLSILAHESSSGDISQTLRATPATYSLTLGNGTGANQAQVAWSDSRTIDAGGEDSLNFQSLPDDRGTVSFSAIKLLYLRNTHASNSLTLVAGVSLANSWTSLGWSDEAVGETNLQPESAVMLANGSASGMLVSSSDKMLYLRGTTNTTYEIILIGEGTVT